MFKKITTQTKSQGKVIDLLNKPYDNYCKNAKKDKNKCFFQPPLFFENSTDFLHYFFDFQKKKGKKGGFSKFPNKNNLLGSKIIIRLNHGNNGFFLWPYQKGQLPLKECVIGTASPPQRLCHRNGLV